MLEKKLQDICKEFFNITNLDYFHYARYYPKKYFVISTNICWNQYFYNNIFLEDYLIQKNKKRIWYVYLPDIYPSIQIEATAKFDIHNMFSVHKIYDHYYEITGFGASQEKAKLCGFYLNHLDYIMKFILFFKSRIDNLKTTEIKDKIKIFESLMIINKQEQKPDYFPKYLLELDQGSIILTKREFICLESLSSGKTLKEIGKTFSISARTVETNINNIKNKFNCRSTSQLIDIFHKNTALF